MKIASRYILLVALIAASCGDNNESNDITFDNNGTSDTGMTDMGATSGADVAVEPDADSMPDMGPDGGDTSGPDMDGTQCGDEVCASGTECQEMMCVPVDSCELALDLGVLQPGQPQNVVGSLIQDGAEDLVATCSGDTSVRDRVITFELTTPAIVEYDVEWVGQFDGVVEIRTDCAQASAAVFCDDNENRQVPLEAGTYYLVLDQKFGNPGSFDLTLTATEVACTADACMGNDLLVCDDPTAPETLSCADTCSSGACDGGTCAAPILITNGGGSFSGDGAAHGSNYNFANNTGCSAGNPNSGVDTPGFDVVFYAPNLAVGDIISVDAQTNDTNVNAIFIMKTCGDTDACVAAYRAENPAWIVDEAGSYYVIIDKRLGTNAPFEYKVGVL